MDMHVEYGRPITHANLARVSGRRRTRLARVTGDKSLRSTPTRCGARAPLPIRLAGEGGTTYLFPGAVRTLINFGRLSEIGQTTEFCQGTDKARQG